MGTILHELIIVISNKGHTQDIMNIAKESGARGGTIVHGKGTADQEISSFLGVKIQPEKELLLIVVPKALTKEIMKNIADQYGTHTETRALSFSLPVSNVCGFVFE